MALCLAWLDRPVPGMIAGTGGLLLGLSILQTIRPEPRRFRLPAFELPQWEEVLSSGEPQVLEQTLTGNVYRLRPTPAPAAGEQGREQQDLDETAPDDNVVLLSADASAALREALAELRRSIA